MHTYVESKKSDINELIFKTKTDVQMKKTDLWLPKGKPAVGEDKFGV